MLKIILNLIISLFLCADEATQSPDENTNTEPTAIEFSSRIQKIKSCSEKIWPDLKLGQYPIYVADYKGTTNISSMTEIDIANGVVRSPSSITTEFLRAKKASPYFVDVPGGAHKGVAISVNMPSREKSKNNSSGKTGTSAKKMICEKEQKEYSSLMTPSKTDSDAINASLDLLMHEAFHNVDQNSQHTCHQDDYSWKGDLNNMQRQLNTDEKIASDVSTYRAAMIYYLDEANKNPTRKLEFMKKAAMWYHKWKTDYPTTVEDLRTLDRVEGSASYVGSMSSAIGKNGCQNSKAIRSSFLEKIQSKMISVPSPLDTQAYGLGAIAGLLLDETGDASWKKKVMQGKTPMEILAEKFPISKTPSTLPSEVSSGQKKFDNYNKCLKDETLRVVHQAYQKPTEYIAIAIPIESTLRHPAAPFTDNGKTWQLTSYVSENVQIENWPQSRIEKTACGTGNYSIILVPKTSLQDNRFNQNTPYGGVSGTIDPSANGTYEQFPLYCSPSNS